jgi:NAD(P)-dependent dehydrogenase (short-subunit alcohol dehydrogenase family)
MKRFSMSKIALVTGANKGIGLETSRQLAQQGVHVIMAARDSGKGGAAAEKLKSQGLDVESVELDVSVASSIAAAVKQVATKHGHLDILINNAGLDAGIAGKGASEQTMEAWHKTFDTNFFGLVAVTQAFMPLLKKAPAGRIVNISSILGSLALHADPKAPIYGVQMAAYNVSKSAVNAYTVQLAYELRDSKMKVNAVHPGHVKTDMGGAAAPMELKDGAKSGVAMAMIGPDGPNGSFTHLGQTLPW